MIIKGQARGRARQLAAHLLSADQNERIQVYECRGTLAQDVEGALVEMEARGMAARSRKPLYHASISPEAATPLTEQQIFESVDVLERRLGLAGQPRVVVLHRKKDREHLHVVWCRIDVEDGTAIADSWNYRLHEKVARELEARFGHRPVESSHARPLRQSSRTAQDYEFRQAERSGLSANSVSDELTALWRRTGGGKAFKQELLKAGYRLARGDRRVFVVMDRAGEVHSLARRIKGVDTASLRQSLSNVDLSELPSVEDARRLQRKETAPTSKFTEAAGEVTRRSVRVHPHRMILHRFAANAKATTIPAKAFRRPFACVARGAADVDSGKPNTAYRSARAALVAEYASRIAEAMCHARRDELDAILVALRAERDAALRALKFAQPGGQRRKRRTRRRVVQPHIELADFRYRFGWTPVRKPK